MKNNFEINFFKQVTPTYQIMNNDGEIINESAKLLLSKKQLIDGYYFMKLSRKLDNKMMQMQRQGRMLTFPPNLGEEALQVAVAFGMDKQDYFVPAFRSAAVLLALGVKVENFLILWNGNEKGNKYDGLNIIPFNIPIATQYSHAAGIGMAFNYLNKNNVAVSFIGDGGTSEGEFYEALNFANLRNAKTIFCINNNKWAISTPTCKETTNTDLACKAIAAGMGYLKVDGNDFFASYEVFVKAREYVLKNSLPLLIEFVTYRQGPHTTSDNPKIYRTQKEEEEGNKTDPIVRLEKYLIKNKMLSTKEIETMETKIDELIKNGIDYMEKNKEVNIDEIFDYTYDENDANLLEQKEECKKLFNVSNK